MYRTSLYYVGLLFIGHCFAHIRFTWPPARNLPLDWLNNNALPSPCGMPQGTAMTTFQKGDTFNLTWHVASPHPGGFAVQLMEGSIILHNFTDGFISADDVTKLYYTVTLPSDYTCDLCTLRVLRQALNYGPNYKFRSCADITIVTVHQSDCSRHGTYTNGACQCEHLYDGGDCQYKDECEDAGDCSDHGLCVHTDSTFYPKKQCYCDAGWLGETCSKVSTVNTMSITDKDYDEAKFGDKEFTIKWRIIEDEVEVVLISKGNNFAAIGFRPLGLTTCTDFVNNNSDIVTLPKNEMDCTDIIIGMARGERSRVGDYYTRDKSSPRLDSVYAEGGENSLTAAIGEYKDGFTTIIFRRKIIATEKQDHSIVDGDMHVIWSRGQDPDFYVANATNHNYYKKNELKYHGNGMHRGYSRINFFSKVKKANSSESVHAISTLIILSIIGTLLWY